MRNHFVHFSVLCLATCATSPMFAQAQSESAASLPSAPPASIWLTANAQSGAQAIVPPQAGTQSPAPAPAGAPPPLLTRQQAEQLALANNPNIRVSDLLALVQHQVMRQTRADLLPDLNGNLTAITANEGSRISSGSLASSRLLQHAGMGVVFTQLITDFGHTTNLVASAKLREKARQAGALASREDIVLATDQVFYSAIEAQATLKVAQGTVSERQTLVDQVSALTSAKLKSDLDLSFAQVNLSQAKLLQLDAQNNVDAAKAELSAVLGYDHQVDYQLVEDPGNLPVLPPDADTVVAAALQNRPDLQSFQYEEQAARKFSRAQHELLLPTISTLGIVGGTPVGSSQYFNSNWYGAVGGNVSIPIFNGFRLTAEASQASLEAKAAAERTRNLRDQVVRDVHLAWLNANTSLQRVTVTDELLKEANLALSLAQTRYQLGLSSIVELSQAELQQTQAAIGNANARSQYGFAISALQFQVGTTP